MDMLRCLPAVLLLAQVYMTTGDDNTTAAAHTCNPDKCPSCKDAFFVKAKWLMPISNRYFLWTGCRPKRCHRRCFQICRPVMKWKTVKYSKHFSFKTRVVDYCECRRNTKLVLKGRVIIRERLNDYDYKESGIDSVRLSVEGYSKQTFTDANGHFQMKVQYPPPELVITASKEGFLTSIKVLDIPDINQGHIENVLITFHKSADPVELAPANSTVLSACGVVRISVPPGTAFRNASGNGVPANISAVLTSISPNDAYFNEAPGVFLTNEGDYLLSFCVLNLFFLDLNGNPVFPDGNTRVQLVNTSVTDYSLWQQNKTGRWEKIKQRSDEQNSSQFVGVIDRGNTGKWLSIGKRRVGKKCFVKLRVFQKHQFWGEVVDELAGLFTPKFLLRVGNEEPYQRLNLDFLSGTDSPGRHCYEVRCSKDEPIFGEITLEVIETLGDRVSNPLPAIPVHLEHDRLPGTLRNKLATLNYTVNGEMTKVQINFEADRDGPFYRNKETCEASKPEQNSLWFRTRHPQFPYDDFGKKVCFARILFDIGVQHIDYLIGTSFWRETFTTYYRVAQKIIKGKQMISISQGNFVTSTCLRYRCSEEGSRTVIILQVELTNVTNANVPYRLWCGDQQSRPAPVLNGDSEGYYYGLDENVVEDRCSSEPDTDKYASDVQCR